MRSVVVGLVTAFTVSACGAPAPKSAFPSDTPVVYTDGAEPALLGEIVTTTEQLSPASTNAVYETVKINEKCRTPRASRRAKVAYVHTYGGHNSVPLHHVDADASIWKNSARRAMMKQAIAEMADTSFEARMMAGEFTRMQMSNQLESPGRIEVLVTETEAPVFLYLTSYNSVLWNIQLAPGAQLDGVVVDAYEGGAIANGAPAKRTGFRIFSKVNGVRCRTETYGEPTPADVRIAAARKMNPQINLGSYPEQWEAEYKTAKAFFQTKLPKLAGKKADWRLTNARGGPFMAVLVGPKPETPFEPKPIERIQLPESIQPYWGTRRGALKYFGLAG